MFLRRRSAPCISLTEVSRPTALAPERWRCSVGSLTLDAFAGQRLAAFAVASPTLVHARVASGEHDCLPVGDGKLGALSAASPLPVEDPTRATNESSATRAACPVGIAGASSGR